MVIIRKDWDIAGISKSIKHKYSRRTLAIDAAAERLGITNPSLKAQIGAKLRSRKNKDWTESALRKEWHSWLSPDEKKAVERAATPSTRSVQRENGLDAARQCLDQAIEHRFATESVVAEPRLKEWAMRQGVGRFLPESLHHAAGRHEDLLRRREDTQTLVTTRQVHDEEVRMLAFARDGKGTCPSLEGEWAWTPVPGSMNRGAERAIRQLLQSNDRVMLLRGGAGTGKTHSLRAFSKAIESRGYNLVAMSPGADASYGTLREAGFKKAETVKKFLDEFDKRPVNSKSVIWVDEAGLVGTPTMLEVFKAAERKGARVVLCGDTKQHAPIERGDALRLLETRIGLVAIPTAPLGQLARFGVGTIGQRREDLVIRVALLCPLAHEYQHPGVCDLVFDAEEMSAEGSYFTGRERQSAGRVSLSRLREADKAPERGSEPGATAITSCGVGPEAQAVVDVRKE